MERSRETTRIAPVIVGIDPGTTTAYALVFLERGEIRSIKTYSFKNGGTAKLIHEISRRGFPVLVACDRKKAPRNAELVARKFGTAVFSPKSDLGVAEKRKLLKRTGVEVWEDVRNDHERDALASALHAYKKLRRIIKSSIREMGKEKTEGEESLTVEGRFLRAVLKDEDYDARSAVKKVAIAGEREKKNPEEKKKGRDPDRILEENRHLREKIAALREELKKRESYIAQLKNEIKNLKISAKDDGRVAGAGSDAVRKKGKHPGRNSEASPKLKKEVAVLKKMLEWEKKKRLILIREWSARKGRAVLAKKLSDLSRDEFERKKRMLRIRRGDILVVEDIGRASQRVVEEIIQKGMLVAASEDGKNRGNKLPRGVRIVSRRELEGVDAGEVIIVDEAGLERIKERLSGGKSIEKIISEYRRNRKVTGTKKNKS